MSHVQVLPTLPFMPLPNGMMVQQQQQQQSQVLEMTGNSSPPSAHSSEDLHNSANVPGKRKIQRSKNACTACHKSRAKCDGGTPCSRCVRIGNGHTCEPFAGKKRGRKSGFTVKGSPSSSSLSSVSASNGLYFGAQKGSYVAQEIVIESPGGSDPGMHSSSSSSPSGDQMQPMTPGVMFPNFSTFDPLGFTFEGYTHFPDSGPYHQHHQHQHQHQDYYGNDALVPSFSHKDVILKSNPKPYIPPSVNLRKDPRKAIYICSATQSFATLIGRPHREIEGSSFREFVPKKIYKGCLMAWFQKYTEFREKGFQYITFKLHTLLLGATSLIPVELNSIIVEDHTGEISIIRMDIQELTTSEALILGLPLFDPNLDFEDPNDANCEKEAIKESCRTKFGDDGNRVPDEEEEECSCG